MKFYVLKYKTKWLLKDIYIVIVITFHIITLFLFTKKYTKEEIEEMDNKIRNFNKKYNLKL